MHHTVEASVAPSRHVLVPVHSFSVAVYPISTSNTVPLLMATVIADTAPSALGASTAFLGAREECKRLPDFPPHGHDVLDRTLDRMHLALFVQKLFVHAVDLHRIS